jgi:hypothetical protein
VRTQIMLYPLLKRNCIDIVVMAHETNVWLSMTLSFTKIC